MSEQLKDSQGLEAGRWGFSGCAPSEAFIYELKASPETWRSFIKLARCGGLKPVQGLMEGKSSQIQTVCILVLSLGWSQVGFIWLDTSDAYQGGAADRVHRNSSCSHMLLGKERVGGGAVWLKWVAPVVALPLLSASGICIRVFNVCILFICVHFAQDEIWSFFLLVSLWWEFSAGLWGGVVTQI